MAAVVGLDYDESVNGGDAILETGGCDRIGGVVFLLFGRRLRAEIGW